MKVFKLLVFLFVCFRIEALLISGVGGREEIHVRETSTSYLPMCPQLEVEPETWLGIEPVTSWYMG